MPSKETPPHSEEARARPKHLGELFWAFSVLALQGFGGVLGVTQRELVERRGWLTNQEFLEETAIGQVLPGPNVCNVALAFGDRHFGLAGALTAMAGLMFIPLLLLLGLMLVYAQVEHHTAVAGAMRGMGAVVAGLIAGTGLKLLMELRQHPLGMIPASLVAAAAFGSVALMRWPLVSVVLGLGGAIVALTGWRLRQLQNKAEETM